MDFNERRQKVLDSYNSRSLWGKIWWILWGCLGFLLRRIVVATICILVYKHLIA